MDFVIFIMEVGEKLALYSILVVASHLGLETYQE
jgi:hypothetical protein